LNVVVSSYTFTAEAWKDLTTWEHFIVAAPNSPDSAIWDSGPDSIEFFSAAAD